MWFPFALLLAALFSIAAAYPQGRVVNGSDTAIEKYPFMASLRDLRGNHMCGCSIIAPYWILTAAHCVDGMSPKYVSVQFASTNLDSNTQNEAKVKRIIVHEAYNPYASYANDIALLELQGMLIFNHRTVGPVKLPASGYEIPQVREGVPGTLVGWGYNETGGMVQTTLQEVKLKIYSDAECNERHEGVTTTHQICGGVDEGGKGQCSGDSGGPLLYEGSLQLGIVSWSKKPCTIAPYPGVYTKVSHYVDWIARVINTSN